MSTDYISPLSLWVVVRRHYCRDGTRFVEPAWVGSGEHTGPAVFVSRLHAHIYAALRNRYHTRDDTNNWQCIPLSAFDLRGHVRDLGGELNCEMTFGFATDAAGALILVSGAPRLRFVELSFGIDAAFDDVTFNFNQWVFDFMRAEWTSIGAPAFEASLDCVESMDDITFARTLDAALASATLCHVEPYREYWTAYDASTASWIDATVCMHACPPTLH